MMKCIVLVKFLPGGSIRPDDFFTKINAEQSWFEDFDQPEMAGTASKVHSRKARSAICIADFDSIEQLAIDLAIMPGAGISNVEVIPLTEDHIRAIKNTEIPVRRS